jgi:hypothetical protein
MKKIISFLLLFAFGLSGCEKDDICDADTPTTPRLVISFYDITNASIKKNVKNLKVIGKDQDRGIVFNKTGIGDAMYITSANTISIPLRTDADTTTYTFIYDSGNPNSPEFNTDVLEFKYTRQNIYVSRACGVKTIFNLEAFIRIIPDADNPWMKQINIKKTNIEYENETHVEVFF